MSRAFLLLLLLPVAAAGAGVAGVWATYDDGKLGARIDALPLPETLPKELTSGLTNRLHVRVLLAGTRDVIAERIVEVAIRYDLWDERFTIVSTMQGAGAESRTLASLAEVDALLRSLRLPKLFDAGALPAGDLTLRAQVLLNPIDREKMRMIRKWVAQNSTPVLDVDQGASMSNVLFNRIFEQYEGGSTLAAAWRFELASAPFRLDQLKHEKR